MKNDIIDFNNDALANLVQIKLKNETLSASFSDDIEISNLHKKIDTELIPTLPLSEIKGFELNKIIQSLLSNCKDSFS